MAAVYLICGNTGAGKSTYALKLAREKQAVVFSIDDWMQTLYGPDYQPVIHGFDWVLQRDERSKEMMKRMAADLLEREVDVIFDMTFGTHEMRQEYRDWAEGLGAEVSLHYLDVDQQTRLSQVQKRNREQAGTYRFCVTEEMFCYVEDMFELPEEEELAGGEYIHKS